MHSDQIGRGVLRVPFRRSYLPFLSVTCITLVLGPCNVTNNPPTQKTIPIRPICTVQVVAQDTGLISWNGRVFISDRNDPYVGTANFGAFHAAAGPIGNPEIPFTNPSGIPDVYGFSEAWFLNPPNSSAQVHRAELTPALVQDGTGATVPYGGKWLISMEDASGTWQSENLGTSQFPTGLQLGTGLFDPFDATDISTTPRFMFVGQASPHMFACAGVIGGDAVMTTRVVETSTDPSKGGFTLGQDVLRGTPNPGDPVRSGVVNCAMVQQDDDISTRVLHLVALNGGRILHSLATNASASGSFSAVSAWVDVLNVLGGNYGQVGALAIVSQYKNLHVFFVAQNNNVYRLWHTVRFPNGNWRAPDDVLAITGDAPNGTVYSFNVAAGACPAFGAGPFDDPQKELLIALLIPDLQAIDVVGVANPPKQWFPGTPPTMYSLRRPLSSGAFQPTHMFVRDLRVSARPFSDTAAP